MISKFGLYIREIRAKKNDSLGQMANKLGVSIPFLSSIEVGRCIIPTDFLERIASLYELTSIEKAKLEVAIFETNQSVKVNNNNFIKDRVNISLMFARRIENIDYSLADKLKEVLENDQD